MSRRRPEAEGAADQDSVGLRILRILGLVAKTDRPVAVSDVADALLLPRPTAHRLCAKLEDLGFLAREPGSRHLAVGPQLFALGLAAILRDDRRGERRALLASLVDQIGETCNLTVLSGSEVFYLDRVESHWPLRLHFEPGSRVPLHCTASGKLLMAHVSAARRKRMLEALDLKSMTPNTLTSRKALSAELDAIRARGYSIDAEEFLLGMNAIAVPVKDAKGRPVAAIACHAPAARMSVKAAIAHLAVLEATAARMSATLHSPNA
jgi:DNA-binding IclR family transcriptional regulator